MCLISFLTSILIIDGLITNYKLRWNNKNKWLLFSLRHLAFFVLDSFIGIFPDFILMFAQHLFDKRYEMIKQNIYFRHIFSLWADCFFAGDLRFAFCAICTIPFNLCVVTLIIVVWYEQNSDKNNSPHILLMDSIYKNFWALLVLLFYLALFSSIPNICIYMVYRSGN